MSLSAWLDDVRKRVNIFRKLSISAADIYPFYEELKRRNYEDERRQMAEEWILCGNWFLKLPEFRKCLELADFYPSRDRLEQLGVNYVSVEALKEQEKSLRVQMEKKLRLEYQLKPIEPAHLEHLREEIRIEERAKLFKDFKRQENISDQEKEIKALTIQVMELTTRFKSVTDANRTLKKEIEYLEKRIEKLLAVEAEFSVEDSENGHELRCLTA